MNLGLNRKISAYFSTVTMIFEVVSPWNVDLLHRELNNIFLTYTGWGEPSLRALTLKRGMSSN